VLPADEHPLREVIVSMLIWMVAADPRPDWDRGRTCVRKADPRALLEHSAHAVPVLRSQDVEWDLSDDYADLVEALEDLDLMYDESGDAKEDALLWFDGASKELKERYGAAQVELVERTISRLERHLPSRADATCEEDVAVFETISGLLYITTRDDYVEYSGYAPVFDAMSLLIGQFPEIFDACGLYEPASVQVSRWSH
jgi:hypothetical protein